MRAYLIIAMVLLNLFGCFDSDEVVEEETGTDTETGDEKGRG